MPGAEQMAPFLLPQLYENLFRTSGTQEQGKRYHVSRMKKADVSFLRKQESRQYEVGTSE